MKNKDLIKMWEQNHLLTCVAEECGEVMYLLYQKNKDFKDIEFEINDLMATIFLLNEKGILNQTYDLTKNEYLIETADNLDEIYEIVSKIQYHTFKCIRFTKNLNDITENKYSNSIEIVENTKKLISRINQNFNLNLWNDFSAKRKKVLKYMKKSEKNILKD